MFKTPNKYRIRIGQYGTTDAMGNMGAFRIPVNRFRGHLNVIAADKAGWEHVSVSTETRCPTWEEMCKVKSLFWDDDDVVVQLHPSKSDYVNNHRYCLHLWRKKDTNRFVELPPNWMVGFSGGASESLRVGRDQ